MQPDGGVVHPYGHVVVRFIPFLLLVACRNPAGAPVIEQSKPIHVKTETVTERGLPDYVALTGTLKANEESDVAADTSGKVVQTFVERGQQVKKGQVLVVLDARSAALTANVAEAQTKLAESQLDQARRECERVKHLLDTTAISQAEYDRQASECTARQWSAAAAQAQQATLSKLVGDSQVRAPFDAIVGERFVNVGQWVGTQTRVATLYQPDPIRLQITVPEADVALVKPDMVVTFTVTAFGDERFKGGVKFISPNVRESTRDLIVEAMVTNPDHRLKPGMFAVALLRVGESKHPVVPQSALQRDETGARVFVVANKRVEERTVQVGEKIDDAIGILQGVHAGEEVVLDPGKDVHDGAEVD